MKLCVLDGPVGERLEQKHEAQEIVELSVKKDAQRQRNRVHRRLVMRDVGKSIYHASSPRAILTGLLGGIKGDEY
jgi:hypothetical protein